ncbi:MAG: hypothetical protein JNJ88_11365 [Planctomycetes bacterium]|nr:hypothetical protein [Planctomycetota bacterium]
MRLFTLPQALERLILLAAVGCAAYFAGRASSPAALPLYAEGTADSNGKIVAVTGPYQQGVSLLYVIDSETKNLAVYECRGGGRSAGRISLVASRRIDLDLRLDGYHDESEYKYSDLVEYFKKAGWGDVGKGTPGREMGGEKSDFEREKGDRGGKK